MPDLPGPFARACLALDLLAVDPGLGGLHVIARCGPVRDRLVARLAGPVRLHPAMSDEALYGGLDLPATLASGRKAMRPGLLADPGTLLLPMAERASSGLTARLGTCLDGGRHVLVALDERAGDEPGLPAALAERMAFQVDLSGVPPSAALPPGSADIDAARSRLRRIALPRDLPRQIAELTLAFGIDSPRAGLFALRAVRAHAALQGDTIGAGDVEAAVALTLAHRATQVPDPAPEPEPEPEDAPDPPPSSDRDTDADGLTDLPQDLLVAAVAAALPEDLLNRTAQRAGGATGAGAGALRKGNRRGRPLPSRPGRPGTGERIDLYATLRAAVPWQRIRAEQSPRSGGLHIRVADIRLKRFEDRSDRLIIFAVDASGSAALARLAEVKGAVEQLLARAYAERDQVCLIAFRGAAAEMLLPPTRSLVQAKRRLAAMPGGGATPLAAGLRMAAAEAAQARRRGLLPRLCLLTDGRSNIALDGSPDRARAKDDALSVGRLLHRTEALVLDCGKRPAEALRELSEAMGGAYLPLPRLQADQVSDVVLRHLS